MLKPTFAKSLLPVAFLFVCRLLTAQTADVTVVTEGSTNSGGNNGKMTITIDPATASAPYQFNISGPNSYFYSNTTSNSVTTLTNLLHGHYSGKIVDNNGCIAFIETDVQKCVVATDPRTGAHYINCEEPKTPDPGDPVAKFYSTGTVNAVVSVTPTEFTFQVFHALPDYLYDQIRATVVQTMEAEIAKLMQTNYSAYEVFSEDEFQSDAPYVFCFQPDGSLVWVFRNGSAGVGGEAVDRNVATSNLGTLYPNPTSGEVHIALILRPSERRVSYMVLNSFGQPVLTRQQTLAEGVAELTLDLSEVPSGMYYIKINTPEGGNKVFPVCKI